MRDHQRGHVDALHDPARRRLAGGCGIFIGLAVSLLLTHLVRSMLYRITPYDPLTLSVGVVLLLTVALAASWIPGRRAASVQPMAALRHE